MARAMPPTPGSRASSNAPIRLSLLDVAVPLALVTAVGELLFPTEHSTLFHVLLLTIATFGAWIALRRLAQGKATADDNLAASTSLGHQARAEARTQMERTRAIVETATEGIVTIDANGIIDTFNGAAERLFGYVAGEVLGQNVKLLMPMPYRDEHDGYLRHYLDTGEKRIIGIGREVVGRRKDGSTFPIDLSVGEGRDGDRPFFTAIIRDITERKELQGKLNQTERLAAVGELAAGVAHEVNNPINTIINCAQLILDGDDAASNCGVIREEGERIAAIVQDLLQFARDDHDRPQATPIHEVLERTLRLIGENFKRHGIKLVVAVPADIAPVKARPQQLQQVLLNLLINAKDALQQDPSRNDRQVSLRAVDDEQGVTLSVRDNGPGIPPHLGNRIFEPFVTTKRAKGGTGLGLSISKSIVEGYGGSIEAVSEPGRFAEFRVRLLHATDPHE
jgi:two-component system sensor kinase FixL